jgi:hypothetical protein
MTLPHFFATGFFEKLFGRTFRNLSAESERTAGFV